MDKYNENNYNDALTIIEYLLEVSQTADLCNKSLLKYKTLAILQMYANLALPPNIKINAAELYSQLFNMK